VFVGFLDVQPVDDQVKVYHGREGRGGTSEMRVEIWIKPGYTFRVYEDADSVEECKLEFLDELKDNIGTEHLKAVVYDDDEQNGESTTKGGEAELATTTRVVI
jgi:hypothetical protein